MKQLTVKLVDLNAKMVEAWRLNFKDEADVLVEFNDLTQVDCDAVVSPANSFGFMDGGVDLPLSNRFGWQLQDFLQGKIKELPERELLVGRSIVLETNDKKVPYLISAPTMRVPMNFNIHTSVNAYLAMKAALIACLSNDNINTVAIPGMCTGCGKMPFDIASNQMYLAYREIIHDEIPDYKSFGEAQKFQNKLNEKGLIWH
ncbi:MAG: macro domain-containing protein [Crocinitomicaceae bacterium]|nr:macro domain-containing protein [Crocinitomicaceae bacterium]